VKRGAEPLCERWMNQCLGGDDRHVAHLLNLLSGTVLTYAFVTRGGLTVARGLAYFSGRSS
jgi:hypothetical protein